MTCPTTIARVRELAAKGMTRHQIAEVTGRAYGTIKKLVREHSIPCVSEPAGRAAVAHKRAATLPQTAVVIDTKRRANPHQYTEAQRRNLNAIKSKYWRIAQMLALPPVTEDEAQRLIAEHIARKGVTVCPAGATPEKPLNAGVWFK